MRFAPWLAAAAGALVYVGSLSNGFALDDIPIVRDNPRIRSLANFREIWLSDWWAHVEQDPQGRRDRLYRPLTMFSFALNAAVGGLRPFGFHLVNVLLHAAVCWLVWRLVYLLLRSPGVRERAGPPGASVSPKLLATLAALLFAVHPIHAEAVANVVGRAEILAALFLSSGLILLIPPTRSLTWTRCAAASICFLAALLSKETAICYPAVAAIVLLHRYSIERDRPIACATPARPPDARSLRHVAAPVAALLVPLLVYFPLRIAALGGRLLRDREPSVLTNPLIGTGVGGRVTGALEVLGRYAALMLAPLRLSSDYGLGVLTAPATAPHAWLGAATAIGLIAALCGSRRSPDSTWRQAATAAAMLVASYALISNTLLLIGVGMAERLFYWPSVPACLLIALIAAAAYRRIAPDPLARRLATAAGAIALLALAGRAWTRSSAWADNQTLFAADVATYPDSVVLNLNHARTLLADAAPAAAKAALPYLHRALDRYPDNPAALFHLGRAYGLSGDLTRAAEHLEAAVRFDLHNTEARRMLAALQTNPSAVARRIEQLRAATAATPADAELWKDLGMALRDAGRDGEAVEALERAADLAPDKPEILYNLAGVLALRGDAQRAADLFQRVLRVEPSNWGAHANLSKLLARSDPAASLEHARRAHRLAPEAFETNVNLAAALAMNGMREEALAQYRQIESKLESDDPRLGFIRERMARLRGRP